METLEEKLARLEAELELEKVKNDVAGGPIECKVTAKGGVSVYRLGRFPVTLYRQQWEKLLAGKEQILQFIADNDANLPAKPDDYKAKKAAEKAGQ